MDDTLDTPNVDRPDSPMTRMRGVVDTDRLDIAALIWMSGVAVYVASAVVFALMLSGDSPFGGANEGWLKVQQRGSTVDFGILCALVIGLAVAAAFDSALSRAAALLGVIGAWALISGFLRLLYEAAAPRKTEAPGQPVFMYGSAFVIAVLGALIAIAAYRLYSTVRYDTEFVEEDDALEPDEL
jgi:hypothetical protein